MPRWIRWKRRGVRRGANPGKVLGDNRKGWAWYSSEQKRLSPRNRVSHNPRWKAGFDGK